MQQKSIYFLLALIFLYLSACNKNDDGSGNPEPGNYILASEFSYEPPILYTAKNKITDSALIRKYLERNIWPFPPAPPRPIDSLVSSFFPSSRTRYPTAPSSISIEIKADGQFTFKSSHFSAGPNKSGRIIKKIGDYSIVETVTHYAFSDAEQVANCSKKNGEVLVASLLDSIIYGNSRAYSYYTNRFPIRFPNGKPELFFTSIHCNFKNCGRTTAKVLNAPHPDLMKKLTLGDTIVTQLGRLPFIKQI